VKKLGELNNKRYSFSLYCPSGRGKTLGALSFAGRDYGKAIVLNVESGPEDGAGGLSTLLHCDGIYDHLDPDWLKETTIVRPVRTWEEAQTALAWLRQDKAELVADGYNLLVLDGGTALTYQIRTAYVNMPPENTTTSKRHNIINALVTDALGDATSMMEISYYDGIYDRYLQYHTLLKQLPFTFVCTYLEGEQYDQETRKIKTGKGPLTVGKKLPPQLIAEVDGFFHVETDEHGNRRWLTDNDPTQFGNMNDAWAKHRFGQKLSKYEEPNGVALLGKIGVLEAPTL
jgi:hypothetical protein